MRSRLESLIVNAMADDDENLESIYKAIAFKFIGQSKRPDGRSVSCFEHVLGGYLLDEIADALVRLVSERLVVVRDSDGKCVGYESFEFPLVWQGWFGLSERGRLELEEIRRSGLPPE